MVRFSEIFLIILSLLEKSLIIFAAEEIIINEKSCTWLPDNQDGTSSIKLAVNCNEINQLNISTFNIPPNVTSRLTISCNDQSGGGGGGPLSMKEKDKRFNNLEDLTLEKCSNLRIDPHSLESLIKLKKFTIKFNKNRLILSPMSLYGLKEVNLIHFEDNNLVQIPEQLFCHLPNLLTLNLTRNFLNDPKKIGLQDCGGSSSSSSSDLQHLDLSYNQFSAFSDELKLRNLQTLNLKSNQISRITADSLNNLINLKVLDLSDNLLMELPKNLFLNMPDLKELFLQNNSIGQLGKGIFHRLEQLIVLDLSGNHLISGIIDHGTFTGLIRLIILNLSHNGLTHIDAKTFKDLFFLQNLNLKNNSIGYIEENAFLPLYNLHTLNLAENRLNTISNQLFNGLFVLNKLTLNNNLIINVDNKAFKNCSSLKELDLSSNALTDVPEAIQDLTFLKSLDLGENQISNFRNGTFRNLNQLTGLRLIDNIIGNLTKGMFWNLPNLQVLNLAKNKIQSIEHDTFKRNSVLEAIRLDENFLTDINGIFATLSSLLWLNLSENHLVWFDYAFIPSNLKWLDIHGNFIEHLGNYYKLQKELSVKTLDASHNRITEIGPFSIPNSCELLFINNNFIKNVQKNSFSEKMNLTRVDMYANDLTQLSLSALTVLTKNHNNNKPIEWYLAGNPFYCDCSMEWLSLSSSNTTTKIMDKENIICKLDHSRPVTHLALSHMHPSDFLCNYKSHCFPVCHCCDFDACDCEMTCPLNCSCYHDQLWNVNLIDCTGQLLEKPPSLPMHVTKVYLDGNNLTELNQHSFIGRKSMKILFLNDSNIQRIHNNTFATQKNLQVLHLEGNKITQLQGDEFKNLDILQELYLENNLLETISELTFHALKKLTILRLDGNRLVRFPKFASLNLLQVVYLGNNHWRCECEELNLFALWLKNVGENVVEDLDRIDCKIPKLITSMNECSSSSSESNSMLISSDFWPIIVVSLCLIIFILLAIVLWFICRHNLKLWLNRNWLNQKNDEDETKSFDAFIGYSPKDEEWVGQVCSQLEHHYNLCLLHRDLPLDEEDTNNYPSHLNEAADSSKRIILILTKNFLATEWTHFEFRQLVHHIFTYRHHHHQHSLAILVDLTIEECDNDLKFYLKSCQRLHYSDRRFLQRLKNFLPCLEDDQQQQQHQQQHINKIINHNHHHHNVNNYTIRTPTHHPPEYDMDEMNYSSATTATPSPKPSCRELSRPVSDHIYSSIDSDYSTLERANNAVNNGIRRHHYQQQQQQQQQQWRGGPINNGQAYLV